MSIVQRLMDGSRADVDVLRALDEQGDQFSKFRDVDFLFRSPTWEKADLVASFINDHQYGRATASEQEGSFNVQVIINMPVTQNIISSVAGFMSCIASIYGLEFDGWGCEIQK